MAKRNAGKPREQGSIKRRGNSLRVKVYAGIGPLTGKHHRYRTIVNSVTPTVRHGLRRVHAWDTPEHNYKEADCGRQADVLV